MHLSLEEYFFFKNQSILVSGIAFYDSGERREEKEIIQEKAILLARV